MIHFEILTKSHPLWEETIAFAENCSWRAGKALAQAMRDEVFTGWERVIAAVDNGAVCGFCNAVKVDCLPDLPYTPYIGFVFVAEDHRGKRISQKMIDFTAGYLRSAGFDWIYLISDHDNLYEKYGFTVIDRQPAPWGETEKVYMKKI